MLYVHILVYPAVLFYMLLSKGSEKLIIDPVREVPKYYVFCSET